MRIYKLILLVLVLNGLMFFTSSAQGNAGKDGDGWFSLFNGKNLDGWKVGENASSFLVEVGEIKIDVLRAHLYYAGEVEIHDFINIEYNDKVMTRIHVNIYIYN